ncbi:cannabinoid receptor 1-like [Nematostella vectensis]|uniref:cannabinoid receptor 1-like n=1 Tax=Nematostella vectensis TaxID=45351 RepID=UPI0020770888|nr:cannabinoid receptor 1-like [Nematostella vectensis]
MHKSLRESSLSNRAYSKKKRRKNSRFVMVSSSFKRVTCISSGVISLFLSFITVICNGGLLYMLYKDPLRCLRKPVTVFIASLAIVDFLTGLISDVSFAVHEFECVMGAGNPPGAIGNFSGISYFFTVNSALLLVAALSIERLIAVVFPHFYRRSVTSKRIVMLVAGIYIFSLLFALLQLARIPEEIYHNMDLNIHITFPLSTVTIMYTVIYINLRKRRKVAALQIAAPAVLNLRRASAIQSTSDARREARNMRIEQKLVSTAFIIVLCMVVALVPYLVFVYMEMECPSCIDTEWFFACRRLCVPFLFINSSVNPIIYAWRLEHYRKSFKAMLVSADDSLAFESRDDILNTRPVIQVEDACNQTYNQSLTLTTST